MTGPPFAFGYTSLPRGTIASVVTYLEQRQYEPAPASPARFDVRRVVRPDVDWYRGLYRAIGAEWLWFSRLELSEDALRAIVHDDAVEVWALSADGRDAGLAELDARRVPGIELAFFGIVSDLFGRGAGRQLLNRALDAAWRRGPSRVWLHTCTLDHPGALAFYQRAGFVPYGRAIEIAEDPRLRGVLPLSAAPHVPVLR